MNLSSPWTEEQVATKIPNLLSNSKARRARTNSSAN